MATGVYKTKRGRWYARIYRNGAVVNVGAFATEVEAIAARSTADLATSPSQKKPTGGSVTLSNRQIRRVKRLKKESVPLRQISPMFGVSYETIRRV